MSVGRLVVDTFVCTIGQPGDDAGRHRNPVAENPGFRPCGQGISRPVRAAGVFTDLNTLSRHRNCPKGTSALAPPGENRSATGQARRPTPATTADPPATPGLRAARRAAA